MARAEARIFTSIWQDQDFRALPRAAQFMYLFLLSQPDLSHCGVIPLRPARWVPMACDSSVAIIENDIGVLESSRPPFVLTDSVTGELLIRSLLRRDGMLTSPKMVKPVQAALYEVESVKLRQSLALELQRALAEHMVHPDYVKPQVPVRGRPADSLDVVIKKLNPQVNTLSDTLSDGVRDRVSDTLPDRYRDRDRDRDSTGSPLVEVVEVQNTRTSEPQSKGSDARERCEWITRHGKGPRCQNNARPGKPYCGTHDPDKPDDAPGFEDFWAAYPRKVGKDGARSTWQTRITKRGISPQKVIEAARRYADDPARNADFTAHPSTWLNQGRYDDGPPEIGSPAGNGRRPSATNRAVAEVQALHGLLDEKGQLPHVIRGEIMR